MKQQAFLDNLQDEWERFDTVLQRLERRPRRLEREALERFAADYRRICHHYALARQRRYGSAVVEQLHERVLRGHRILYRRRGVWGWQLLGFIGGGFAATVRRNGRLFWLAAALFWLPGVVMGLACYHDPDLIYSVLPPSQVAEFEQMYDPDSAATGRTEARAADSDLAMFGYYIYNNVGIGFRTFALGILFGLGTAAVLLFNGVVLGGVAGYVTQAGLGATFWDFVVGHSALELTAITIAGAAGLVLAAGVLAPGRRSRGEALKLAAAEAVKLVAGAMLMLFAAAFVEAFWSPHHVFDSGVKYLAGGLLWAGVIFYLLRAGRRHGP